MGVIVLQQLGFALFSCSYWGRAAADGAQDLRDFPTAVRIKPVRDLATYIQIFILWSVCSLF